MATAKESGGKLLRRSGGYSSNRAYFVLLLVVLVNGITVLYLSVSTFRHQDPINQQPANNAQHNDRGLHLSNIEVLSVHDIVNASLAKREEPAPLPLEYEPIDYIPTKNIYQKADAYAGGWWQTSERFMDMELDGIEDRIAPSFNAFLSPEQLRMTQDWLEFSVEHLSKWWKITEWRSNLDAYSVLMDRLLRYVHLQISQEPMRSRDPLWLRQTAEMQKTLAVVTFAPYLDDHEPQKSQVLTVVNLASTIASLFKVNVGRVVVACNRVDIKATTTIFSAVHNLFLNTTATKEDVERFLHHNRYTKKIPDRATFAMEFKIGSTEVALVTVPCREEHGTLIDEEPQIPKATLLGLRQAIIGYGRDRKAFARKWLGPRVEQDRRTRHSFVWDYVYMTEPDTLLYAKTNALPAMAHALQQGNVVVPHRLQPIPHESDVPTIPKHLVVPAIGNYSHVETFTPEHLCCDENRHPAWNGDMCDDSWNLWFRCGFYDAFFENETAKTNVQDIANGHSRLLLYGFMRLQEGSTIVHAMANNNAKVCRPQKGGRCPKVKEEWEVSKRFPEYSSFDAM